LATGALINAGASFSEKLFLEALKPTLSNPASNPPIVPEEIMRKKTTTAPLTIVAMGEGYVGHSLKYELGATRAIEINCTEPNFISRKEAKKAFGMEKYVPESEDDMESIQVTVGIKCLCCHPAPRIMLVDVTYNRGCISIGCVDLNKANTAKFRKWAFGAK
jgi:hypothetical protein